MVLVVGVLALLAAGGAIGYALHDDRTQQNVGVMHSASENVRASDVGSVAAGRRIYTSAGCVACHSYNGVGGKDGPPLDFMRGQLAVADIAAMTGRIWNHVPAMERLFKEEGIPFPRFTGHQMADLVAYIHGGGSAPAMGPGMMGGG